MNRQRLAVHREIARQFAAEWLQRGPALSIPASKAHRMYRAWLLGRDDIPDTEWLTLGELCQVLYGLGAGYKWQRGIVLTGIGARVKPRRPYSRTAVRVNT